MSKKLAILVSCLACFFVSRAQQVSLLFMGDAMQHETQLKSAHVQGNTYNYDSCYKYISNIFAQSEIVVANLEVPLGPAPYSGYPAFCAPLAFAEALKNAGVNYMITANNHSCDRGKRGIEGTISKLDSIGVIHTGMFKNAEERTKKYPLLIEKNGIKISLLNYTYGTNGVKIPSPNIVNLIDEKQICIDVDSAKKQQPDVIIACMHWGVEYSLAPNTEQQKLVKLLNDLGVNIIIGSHPHVVQPMHFTNNRLTVYSLGNFISNQRKLNTDGGSVVRFVLSKNDSITQVDSVSYMLTWVYTPTVNGKKKFYVLPAATFENDTTFFGSDTTSLKSLRLFTKNTRKFFKEKNQNVNEMKYFCE